MVPLSIPISFQLFWFAGTLRNRISQSVPDDVRSLDVWAAINQRMGLVKILIYGLGAKAALGMASPYWLGALIIVCTGALAVDLKKVLVFPRLVSKRAVARHPIAAKSERLPNGQAGAVVTSLSFQSR